MTHYAVSYVHTPRCHIDGNTLFFIMCENYKNKILKPIAYIIDCHSKASSLGLNNSPKCSVGMNIWT